jgi:hypothetical protein
MMFCPSQSPCSVFGCNPVLLNNIVTAVVVTVGVLMTAFVLHMIYIKFFRRSGQPRRTMNTLDWHRRQSAMSIILLEEPIPMYYVEIGQFTTPDDHLNPDLKPHEGHQDVTGKGHNDERKGNSLDLSVAAVGGSGSSDRSVAAVGGSASLDRSVAVVGGSGGPMSRGAAATGPEDKNVDEAAPLDEIAMHMIPVGMDRYAALMVMPDGLTLCLAHPMVHNGVPLPTGHGDRVEHAAPLGSSRTEEALQDWQMHFSPRTASPLSQVPSGGHRSALSVIAAEPVVSSRTSQLRSINIWGFSWAGPAV